MLVGSQDFQVGAAGDVPRMHDRLAGRLEGRRYLVSLVQAQPHFLQIQDDVGDVFLDARDGGEFVQHALDADGVDRIAGQRGKQNAPQRVTDRDAVAAFERFADETPVSGGDFLFVELDRLGFD
jgi:hypothetical protein